MVRVSVIISPRIFQNRYFCTQNVAGTMQYTSTTSHQIQNDGTFTPVYCLKQVIIIYA